MVNYWDKYTEMHDQQNVKTQQWYMSYKFADSLRAGSGLNCSCAVFTLKNSSWWTEELSETCGDTIEKSQAPDDGCINVRNMLSIEEVK